MGGLDRRQRATESTTASTVYPPGAVRPDNFEVEYMVSDPSTGDIIDVAMAEASPTSSRRDLPRALDLPSLEPPQEELHGQAMSPPISSVPHRQRGRSTRLGRLGVAGDRHRPHGGGSAERTVTRTRPMGRYRRWHRARQASEPAVEAYLESYYKPDAGLPPVKILVQFDRDSGKYEVTFEDDGHVALEGDPARTSSRSARSCARTSIDPTARHRSDGAPSR